MRHRLPLVLPLALLLVVGLAPAAAADHAPPSFTTGTPASSTFNSGGEGAEWELVGSFLTGNPHTDVEFFTQTDEETGQVETFVSSGVLGAGPNGGGQTILQLTEGGEVDPSFVSAHPSAACANINTSPTATLGLQHDVEALPKGDIIFNTDFANADRTDAQILLDSTDQRGRCHDQGRFGVGAPRGGLEIIDVTDVANPVEIGLVSHIAEAHTVNADPRRPHIAYAATSAGVAVDGDGTRSNENPASTARFELDGFEVLDLSSCMDFPADTSVEDKRAACAPEVYRFRYPTPAIGQGHTNPGGVTGCHELELYPEDVLSCGGGQAGILFDIGAMFDDAGTPDDFTDDTINGDPLPCRRRASTSTAPVFTGALVTDCVVGGDDTAGPGAVQEDPQEIDLTIPAWLELGAPSVEGVVHLGSAFHQGGGSNASDFNTDEDIAFDHEAELTHSRRFLLATDERGGGASPPGATCSPGLDNPLGNGGLHAYAVDRLQTDRPASPDEAFEAYALTPEGEKAIFRVEPNLLVGPEAIVCTSHLMQQIPGQNRVFMAWYSQGTRVLDLIEHPDGTFEFSEAGFFIPDNANQWSSAIFKMQANEDGTFTYWGIAGDFTLDGTGRNSLDVYKVTLPAPPEPAPRVPVGLTEPPPDGGEPTEVPTDPTTAPTTAPTDSPTTGSVEVVRAEGGDRVATSVGASQVAFDAADTVVLGRDDDYADSLAGGPLAARLDAPLLLTDRVALSDATAAEIDRLGASEVVILGGNDAVTPAVEAELVADGLTVRRVFGDNRFATAVAVADELGAAHDSVVLAEGFDDDLQRGWPDAVAASAEAAATGTPILLAVTDSLPGETDAALDRFGVTETVLVGGNAALDPSVAAAVADHGERRLFGDTRYGTSAAINREALDRGRATDSVWLAKGTDWADALTGGPAAARQAAPLLLVDPSNLDDSAETRDLLASLAGAVDRLVLVGGDAISADVEADAVDLLTPDQNGAGAAPAGSRRGGPSLPTPDAGLLLLAATLLPAAALLGRRRRTTAA